VQSLIQTLPSAIILMDGDTITAWNTSAAALYGWAAHEAVGSAASELILDPVDVPAFREVLATVADRGKWEGNFRVARRDGTLLVSSFVATTVRDGDQRRTAWVATDVVDQHLAEQEREVLVSTQSAAARQLETTIGLLEALLESAPVGIAVVDLDLVWTHANGTFVEMVGADVPPIGEHVDDLTTMPVDAVADLRRVVATGHMIRDRRLALRGTNGGVARHINASYFPITAGPDEPTGAGLMWIDVTAAEMAEGERERLVRRASAAQSRLALLSSTSAVLMGSADLDRLLDRLARVIAPATCDWCVIQMIDRDGEIDSVAVSGADRTRAETLRQALLGGPAAMSPDSPVATALRTGQAQLVSGAPLQRSLGEARAVPTHAGFATIGLTSVVVVPIRARGASIGILMLGNSGGDDLSDDDLDVGVEIAHRAALAFERAITYRNEHALAQELQQALLPGRIPQIDGIRIATHYSAAADAATVGGDWYDVLRLSPSVVALCIGDVVGHDIAAAAGMGRLRNLIHAFAVEAVKTGGAPDPGPILDRVNGIVDDDPSAWATCVLAVIDLTTGEMVWSTAGHPPPLLCRDGDVRVVDDITGSMIGVPSRRPRETGRMKLFAGDRLLFFTDGLFERRDEPIDIGLARVTEALHMYRNQPLGRMCTEITSRMLGDERQSDDIALLAAEITDR
jgi:PAS domain S-box-containing protein